MNHYLELLEKGKITPNFWCSKEYFEKAGLKLNKVGDWVYLSEEGWIIFPPINEKTLLLGTVEGNLWSDFPDYNPKLLLSYIDFHSKFLDYEYIYAPKSFLSMEGGKWAVFRKNCRKWPRRFGEGNLKYDWISNHPLFSGYTFDNDLDGVLVHWLDKKEEEIQDDEVMLQYLHKGRNRRALWDKRGNIYGINIWDENYKYINFRYCICRPEEFLSEYMRWLFYTDPLIQSKNKLVNDGGVLDNPDLKKFKDKMNPISIREVNSWFKREANK